MRGLRLNARTKKAALVAAPALALALAFPGAAFAADAVPLVDASSHPGDFTPNTPSNASAADIAPTSSSSNAPASTLAQSVNTNSGLAITGSDVVELTGLGVLLIGVGGAILYARRKHATNS